MFVRSSVLLLLLLLLRHVIMDTSLPSCSRAVVWLSGSVYEGHCAVGSLRRLPCWLCACGALGRLMGCTSLGGPLEECTVQLGGRCGPLGTHRASFPLPLMTDRILKRLKDGLLYSKEAP